MLIACKCLNFQFLFHGIQGYVVSKLLYILQTRTLLNLFLPFTLSSPISFPNSKRSNILSFDDSSLASFKFFINFLILFFREGFLLHSFAFSKVYRFSFKSVFICYICVVGFIFIL